MGGRRGGKEGGKLLSSHLRIYLSFRDKSEV